jgi:NAD(P)-dependent dehydrogenase (short-subunit alcohol dehydrogenase family)
MLNAAFGVSARDAYSCKAASLKCRPGRIVTVSSSAHRFGKINFDDLQYEKSYSAWGAYGQSKLANILFTYELAERLPAHIKTNTLHPGLVATDLQR